MIVPQPFLQVRFWEHPGLTAYVDSFPTLREGETRPTSGIPSARNGTRYTYNSNRTPDYYLKSGAAPAYTPLTDDIGGEITHFSGTRRANDVSTWSVTIEYDGNDRRADAIWEAAKHDRAFATLHITDPADDMDLVNAFLEMDLFNGDIFTGAASPTLAAGTGSPGALDRGFSGPVLRVAPSRNRNKLSLTIQGSCWGKLLQQTVQTSSEDLDVSQRTGNTGFQNLLRSLFSWNSEYAVSALDESDLGTADAQGTRDWRTALDQAGLADAGLARTKTQVAFWGLINAFDASATTRVNGLRGNTVFAMERGQHSLLRACQRLAERAAGVLFDPNMPAVRWFAPLPNTRFWGYEDYVEANMNLDRPEATAWLTKHNDYRRDWLIYVLSRSLVNDYGEIQASNQSTAVRPLSEAAEPSEDEDEADRIILETIQAQNAGLALYEAAKYSATVGSYYQYPLRFGVDVGMGTPIDLYLTDTIHSEETMPIRQAAAVYANNSWSWSFGLGSRSQVLPVKQAAEVS